MPPAPTRVTDILRGGLAGKASWTAGYVQSDDPSRIVSVNGGLPVVDHLGRRALKLEVRSAGPYSVGLARDWVRFYLDDYLPNGVLELGLCGAVGGERVRIGFASAGSPQRPEVQALVDAPPAITSWQDLRIPIREIVAAAPDVDLVDLIKVLLEPASGTAAQTLFISHVRFVTEDPEPTYPAVKVNQLGYRPGMSKVAFVGAPGLSTRAGFKVVDPFGAVVAEGKLKVRSELDSASGDRVLEADFSDLRAPGVYRLLVEGVGESDAFSVSEDVYDVLFADAMRFYYLQRCNMALLPEFAGEQAHEACHLGDREAKTADGSDTRDVTGGWHDAGDHNKYPNFLANTVLTLLENYRWRPSAFPDGQLNLPESGNGVSDVLDEVAYELDWLLKMQITEGPQAGAVYDRLHQSAAKPEDPNPGYLQEPRRLLPPTSEATSYSVANWALAAAVFGEVPALRERARLYRAAAEMGWTRLLADGASDEVLLPAAAMLLVLTGEPAYEQATLRGLAAVYGGLGVIGLADRFEFHPSGLAVAVLANADRETPARAEARRAVLEAARWLAATSQVEGYATPLWNRDHYCWSSTANIGRLGVIGLVANRFAPDPSLVRMAEDALHYTLGRNAVATSFVTGYGARWTAAYHSLYGSTNGARLPMPPGFVPGGVNMHESRGLSAWPSKHYQPDPNNWTINEPAIYYNAPLVFLAGQLAELKGGG